MNGGREIDSGFIANKDDRRIIQQKYNKELSIYVTHQGFQRKTSGAFQHSVKRLFLIFKNMNIQGERLTELQLGQSG